MALDPSGITGNKNMIYTAGEVVFAVALYRRVTVRVTSGTGHAISTKSRHAPLIRHAAALLQRALQFTESLEIDEAADYEGSHCGLGSSSALIAAVAASINDLYGRPIPFPALIRYVAQNHGEEIDDSRDYLMPVQCLGGSAAAGMSTGSVLVLAGESTVVGAMSLSNDYRAVIGIPADYARVDAKTALEEEMKFFPQFADTGKQYGQLIAYRMLHECLPALAVGNLRLLGDLVFDYRFCMGSIENCSFLYPALTDVTRRLAPLKNSGVVEVLSISSVGPSIFAITKNPDQCVIAFEDEGLITITVDLHDGIYDLIDDHLEERLEPLEPIMNYRVR